MATEAQARKLAGNLAKELTRDFQDGEPRALTHERYFQLIPDFAQFICLAIATKLLPSTADGGTNPAERDLTELLGPNVFDNYRELIRKGKINIETSGDVWCWFPPPDGQPEKGPEKGRPGFVGNTRLTSYPGLAVKKLAGILTRIATQQATPQYVTAQQIASYLQVSKRTLERWIKRRNNPFPLPANKGGGGKAAEWIWFDIVSWLRAQKSRDIPDRFPSEFSPS